MYLATSTFLQRGCSVCTGACLCKTYDNSSAQEDEALEADESDESDDKITLSGWEKALYVYAS